MNRRERRAIKAQAGDGAPAMSAAASLAFSAGLWEQQAGLLPQAAASFRKALAQAPRHPDIHNNLGLVLAALGQADEAVAAFRRAVALRPSFPEALNNLASTLRQQGRTDEALALYRKAAALAPDFAGTHNNLGSLLLALGRTEEAIRCCERALALRPDFAEAHNNLGSALQSAGQTEAAIAAFRRAIAHKPDYADAFGNLGSALHDLGRLDEALAAYRQAAALKSSAVIQNNLGMLLQDMAKPAEAIAAFRRALALKPGFPDALNNLVRARKMACDWAGLEAEAEQCRAALRAGAKTLSPFAMLWLPTTRAEQLRCARGWTETLTRRIAPLPRAAAAAPRERINLAYLSADFREHPVSHLAAELFERHDRAAFALTAYSAGPDDGSDLRRRVVRAFDRFVEIGALPPQEAARQIRADAIDILVDLTGHTRGGRIAILAARPAPIQVNFLGFAGTFGAPFVDYIIADPVALPLAEQPYYDERIVHLPDCFLPLDTTRAAADPPPRAQCGLPETGFVFCCFNNAYKFTPAMLDLWARLLRAVPASLLWLADGNDMVKANLRREAAARGIAERIVFAPRLPSIEAHLARLRHADLFLDTLPFNAHATAADALRAGVPVLTCAGETFAGRVAASLVTAAGCPELATRSLAEYEALALRLAGEPGRLAALRARLAAGRERAPLFDSTRYVRAIEAAFRRMWERHRAGAPPESFAVARSL